MTAHPSESDAWVVSFGAISKRGRGGSGVNWPPLARIGVGFDGRRSGRDAVVLASLLAYASHVELVLIAVFEEPIVATVAPAGVDAISLQRRAQATRAATRDSLVRGARTVVHSDALVWRGLRHVARREHCDLLVVGSGRRARAGQTALGEHSQEFFCHLGCPLAIAPRGMANGDSPRLERIGVGFDGKAESHAALKLAAWIAVAAKAELEVRGIVNYRGPAGLTERGFFGADPNVTGKTRSLLKEALIAAGATGAPVQVDVIPGNPADALCALGARVDLIVIGSGDSGPGARVSLGSTGSALVGGARCPILVVPRPGDTAAI